MPHLPVFVVFRFTLQHPIFDDTVLEHSEVDLLMAYRIALEVRVAQPFLNVIVKMLMEPFNMHRVERVLHDLKPVARNHRCSDVAQDAVADKEIPARQERHGFRAQVSKDQPSQLLNRVSGHTDTLFEVAVRILGLLVRLLETLSVPVIQPAVVSAAQALLLGNAQEHRHPPVGALRADQSRTSLFVSVQNQLLAQNFHSLGRPLDEL